MVSQAPNGLTTDNSKGCAAADRREALRLICRPRYACERPTGVNLFGWAMTVAGLLALGLGLALLAWAVAGLLRQRPMAGEHLLAGGIVVLYAGFFAKLWSAFRTRPDWRVAPEVPCRVKLFAALGSAVSASLAAAMLAVALFSVCARQMFDRGIEAVAGMDVGKVPVLLTALGLTFLFMVWWFLFQALGELRAWSRSALAAVLAASVALAVGFFVADRSGWLADDGNAVVLSVVLPVGLLAVVGLMLQASMATGRSVASHFHQDEFEQG